MLHLTSETDPDWARRAVLSMPDVLLDHAHLEKKAAGTAINLIFRYPQHEHMMVPLSRLAREELAHFEQVLRIMKDREIPFERQRPAPYAGRVMKVVRLDEPNRLLDTLVCCSVIEARSCERMKLLSEHLQDQELIDLYAGLLACEARHHGTYVELATEIFERELVMERLEVIGLHEAEVLEMAPREPRMHNR